jgi:hypothetical protein
VTLHYLLLILIIMDYSYTNPLRACSGVASSFMIFDSYRYSLTALESLKKICLLSSVHYASVFVRRSSPLGYYCSQSGHTCMMSEETRRRRRLTTDSALGIRNQLLCALVLLYFVGRSHGAEKNADDDCYRSTDDGIDFSTI